MKKNNSVYGILITTCVMVLMFSIGMIVYSAINFSKTMENTTGFVVTIVGFGVLMLLCMISLAIIIMIKHSVIKKIKYDNDENTKQDK